MLGDQVLKFCLFEGLWYPAGRENVIVRRDQNRWNASFSCKLASVRCVPNFSRLFSVSQKSPDSLGVKLANEFSPFKFSSNPKSFRILHPSFDSVTLKMTSLPVRKLYQRIGEQIDAQVDAVVHIENSIYLRSKAIDNDSESLKAFLEYSISLLGKCIF